MKTLKHLFALPTLALLFNTAAFAQLSAGGGIAGSAKFENVVHVCTAAANLPKSIDGKLAALKSCFAKETRGTVDVAYYKGKASGMVISGMRVVASVKGLASTEVEWTYRGGTIDATEVEWTYNGIADFLKIEGVRKY